MGIDWSGRLIYTCIDCTIYNAYDGVSGRLKKARNGFLFFLGIIGMIAGTIVSVTDIINFFVTPPEEGNFPKCNETSSLNITLLQHIFLMWFWTLIFKYDKN